MKKHTMIWGLAWALILFYGLSNGAFAKGNESTTSSDDLFQERWACSQNFQIAINQHNKPSQILTSGHKDFKPSWSKTEGKLTFFRRLSRDKGFHTWKTKICSINIDGTGFRELTSGDFPDFNPTWTRDGSNMIIFNRYSTVPVYKNQIFIISPDGTVGDAQLVSHPSNKYYEWAMSALKDGRILIDRLGKDFAYSFLLTPYPGKMGKYEELTRPTEKLWHKLSISPDETKVTYMLDNDSKIATYKDAVIAIADFDVANLKMHNQVIITEMDPDSISEYPRWSSDGNYVIYDSNNSGEYQVYAYNLKDETTARISFDANGDYRFAHVEDSPK